MSGNLVYLTRRAHFSASHRLHKPELSDAENEALYGKCNHAYGHGHNYELFVTVKGRPKPETDLVIFLEELDLIISEEIVTQVDHRHLNEDVGMFEGINPSLENIVVKFWEVLETRLPEGLLFEVKLHETENNSAFYRGDKY